MAERILYINGKFLGRPAGGVQRYADEFTRHLDALLPEGVLHAERVVVLAPSAYTGDPGWRNLELRRVGRLGAHLWEHLELPRYARGPLYSPFTAPLFKRDQAVTLHDASPFAHRFYTWKFRAFYTRAFRMLAKRARVILTDSYFSRDELARYCGRAPERIDVAYLGSEHFRDIKPDESIFERIPEGVRGCYVLFVASMSPHKNLEGLLRAMREPAMRGVPLVAAGGVNSDVFADRGFRPGEDIFHLGRVSDEQLKALYGGARVFAFPSFYEGFGLPPLEALWTDTPSVVSNRASLPEVMEAGALYCNPDDPLDIAARLRELYDDEPTRKRVLAAGRLRLQTLTWESCVRTVAEVLNRGLLNGSS